MCTMHAHPDKTIRWAVGPTCDRRTRRRAERNKVDTLRIRSRQRNGAGRRPGGSDAAVETDRHPVLRPWR